MPKVIRRKSLTVSGRSTKSWNSWFGRLSPSQQQFLKSYFFHLVFLFFLANYVVVRQLQLTFFAQSCMSREMVTADNRCLYIYGGQVYEKGTRSKPHKNQRCGTDVTTIIPSFHTSNMAKYMDPNLVGTICSGQPPAATATPTTRPTNTPAPQATATKVPTQPPAAPTATRVPTPTYAQATAGKQPTSSPIPTATLRLLPTTTPRVITQSNPTSTPRIIAQVNPTATRIPTIQQQPTNPANNQPANPTITSVPTTNFKPPTSNQRSGFARYLADSEISNSDPKNSIETEESEANLKPETTNDQPQTSNFITNLVRLSQIAVGASFGLMITTTLAVGIRKLNQKFTKKK